MDGMPLLLACDKPMTGPMVPVISRFSMFRAEGMDDRDRVRLVGFGPVEKFGIIAELIGVTTRIGLDLNGWDYVQAERMSGEGSIHVWLERDNG